MRGASASSLGVHIACRPLPCPAAHIPTGFPTAFGAHMNLTLPTAPAPHLSRAFWLGYLRSTHRSLRGALYGSVTIPLIRQASRVDAWKHSTVASRLSRPG